jgi:hypothetical protein
MVKNGFIGVLVGDFRPAATLTTSEILPREIAFFS